MEQTWQDWILAQLKANVWYNDPCSRHSSSRFESKMIYNNKMKWRCSYVLPKQNSTDESFKINFEIFRPKQICKKGRTVKKSLYWNLAYLEAVSGWGGLRRSPGLVLHCECILISRFSNITHKWEEIISFSIQQSSHVFRGWIVRSNIWNFTLFQMKSIQHIWCRYCYHFVDSRSCC